MKYGVKYENEEIKIMQGTEEELQKQGMYVCDTECAARTKGFNMEYAANRRKFNAMTLEELDSEEARILERKIWGQFADYEEYTPGEYIERRKQLLKEKAAQ